jgi:hypothetical protein
MGRAAGNGLDAHINRKKSDGGSRSEKKNISGFLKHGVSSNKKPDAGDAPGLS